MQLTNLPMSTLTVDLWETLNTVMCVFRMNTTSAIVVSTYRMEICRRKFEDRYIATRACMSAEKSLLQQHCGTLKRCVWVKLTKIFINQYRFHESWNCDFFLGNQLKNVVVWEVMLQLQIPVGRMSARKIQRITIVCISRRTDTPGHYPRVMYTHVGTVPWLCLNEWTGQTHKSARYNSVE